MPVIPKGYIITDKCCDKTRFYDSRDDFPETGIVSRLYVDRETGIIYVWDGSEYISADKFHSNIVGTAPYDSLNPLTGWVAPTSPIAGNTVEVKFTDGVISNYTFDGSDWAQDFLVYNLGGELVSPFNLWTHIKTFINGNETNPSHWDFIGFGVKHKAARSILGYRDRLAQPASLDKDELYRVSWDISNYVSGGISVNVGESFTKESYANGSYVDYVVASNDDLISIQSIPSSDLIISNISVRKVISPNINTYGKLSVKGTLSTDGYIETGKNKRIQIGYWDNGTNYRDDEWQIFENTQPSISIGYNSMTRGTGVCVGPNAGRDNTNLGYITAFGINALKRNTTGHSTGFGTGAGQNNTTGNLAAFGDECLSSAVSTDNNGFGYYTLNQATGTGNAAFGHQAGRLVSTGNSNSLFGHQAGYNISTGSNNAAFGFESLYSNSLTGDWNCAFGSNSLRSCTSGSGNVAIGYNCMTSNNTGGFNVGIGFATLGNNTTGNGNTGIGQFSMRFNTSGSNNTAFGSQALRNNLTGEQNTAIGFNSLYSNLTSFNVGVGSESLSSLTSGTYNTSLGVNSGLRLVNGDPLTTSNNSVFIGSDTRSFADNQTNEIVIGYNALGSGSNTAVIGNSSITVLYLAGSVGWFQGDGTPEGAVAAPVGSFYSRKDGGAGTSFYVKESGSGNTGWVGK